MLLHNFTALGILGGVLSVALATKFGPIVEKYPGPFIGRVVLGLSAFLLVYVFVLLYLFIFNRGLIDARARLYWVEQVDSKVYCREPDPSFKDMLDLAAWIQALALKCSYSMGWWEFED